MGVRESALVEDLILASTEEDRQHALDALEPLQRGDFTEILDAMDGLPVTIRLIDPPLHEFLPDLTELSVKIALAGDSVTEKDKDLLAAVRRLHEQNPMLGLRGVRLGLVIPGLFNMQVRAIAHASADRQQAGRGGIVTLRESMPLRLEYRKNYDARWREFRLTAVEAAGNVCQRCGQAHRLLNVAHLSLDPADRRADAPGAIPRARGERFA